MVMNIEAHVGKMSILNFLLPRKCILKYRYQENSDSLAGAKRGQNTLGDKDIFQVPHSGLITAGVSKI